MFLTKHENRAAKGALLINHKEKEEKRQLWIARLCDLEESETKLNA